MKKRVAKSPLIQAMMPDGMRLGTPFQGQTRIPVADAAPWIAQLRNYADIANGGTLTQRKAIDDGGLPANLKSGIESLSGIAMDDVRVHYNSPKPAQLQAHAFAQGTDIHLAAGQEKHLAHEAWHVVQQKQGRVKPTLQLKGVAINDDTGLEREADVMGDKAMEGEGGSARLNRLAATSTASTQLKTVQRVVEEVKRDEGGKYFKSTEMARKLGASSEFATSGEAELADAYYKSFDLALDEKSFAWGKKIDQGGHVTLPKGFEKGACYGFAEVGLANRFAPNDALYNALVTQTGCFLCKSLLPSEDVLDAQQAHSDLVDALKKDATLLDIEAKLDAAHKRYLAAQEKVDELKPLLNKVLGSKPSSASTSQATEATPLLADSKIDVDALTEAVVAAQQELKDAIAAITALQPSYTACSDTLLSKTKGSLGKNVNMQEVAEAEVATAELHTDKGILSFLKAQADGGLMVILTGGKVGEADHAISISLHGGNVTIVDADSGIVRASKAECLEVLETFAESYKASWPKARVKFLKEQHQSK